MGKYYGRYWISSKRIYSNMYRFVGPSGVLNHSLPKGYIHSQLNLHPTGIFQSETVSILDVSAASSHVLKVVSGRYLWGAQLRVGLV